MDNYLKLDIVLICLKKVIIQQMGILIKLIFTLKETSYH